MKMRECRKRDKEKKIKNKCNDFKRVKNTVAINTTISIIT